MPVVTVSQESSVSRSKTIKKKRDVKSAKHATATSNSRPASNKLGTSKATKSRDSSKRGGFAELRNNYGQHSRFITVCNVYFIGKEPVSSEVKEIMTAMDQYYAELSSIEMIIRNWDPIKMTMVIITGCARTRIYRQDESGRGQKFRDSRRNWVSRKS